MNSFIESRLKIIIKDMIRWTKMKAYRKIIIIFLIPKEQSLLKKAMPFGKEKIIQHKRIFLTHKD